MSNFSSSNSQVLCVICHSPIDLTNFGRGDIIKNYVGCPNGHLIHYECLKKWINTSQNCPVCHEKYEMLVINIFREYLDQIERDRNAAEERKRIFKEKETLEASKTYSIDPEFEKKISHVTSLFTQGSYSEALNLLWDMHDSVKYSQNDPCYLLLLFNISMVYYSLKKPAQSIQQLMKLIRIDFKYPLAFYYLGLNYQEIGLKTKAKWAFDRALLQISQLTKTQEDYKSYVADIKERLASISNIV